MKSEVKIREAMKDRDRFLMAQNGYVVLKWVLDEPTDLSEWNRDGCMKETRCPNCGAPQTGKDVRKC